MRMRISSRFVSVGTLLFCLGTAGAQGFSKDPMTVTEKFTFFEQPVFGPRAALVTSISAGFRMFNPPDRYPSEWRQGLGAYGRNFGDHYARHAAQATASFAASALLHEDTRYVASRHKFVLARVAHAIGYTVIDRSDSGHRTLAVANFAGAMAGGFVGNSYMPRRI